MVLIALCQLRNGTFEVCPFVCQTLLFLPSAFSFVHCTELCRHFWAALFFVAVCSLSLFLLLSFSLSHFISFSFSFYLSLTVLCFPTSSSIALAYTYISSPIGTEKRRRNSHPRFLPLENKFEFKICGWGEKGTKETAAILSERASERGRKKMTKSLSP